LFAFALLPPAFCSLLPAAARESAFFSAAVWLGLGSQLPLVQGFLPATGLNPGQQWLVFFAEDFFAEDFFAVVMAI
jgi:hypothetical protein